MTDERIFLLSPAFCGGRRATMLLRPDSPGLMAQHLRAGTLRLGDAFTFLSGLYFRGKLSYGRAFGRSERTALTTLVITPSRGLLDPETIVDEPMLKEFAATDVTVENARYTGPLARDAAALAASLEHAARVVLLGSVATGKYVDLLAPAFGDRLHFPSQFVGRGDMSRGGLLLRSVASGIELLYYPLQSGVRPRGARPPKLEPIHRIVGV